MKPWMWYVYGILPMQGLPMNVARYITTGHKPTGTQLAGGFVGSMATGYALGYFVHPNIPQGLAYHKLRMLGFQLSEKEMMNPKGPLWRMPLWVRLSMPAVAGMYAGNQYVNFAYSDPQQMSTPGKVVHRRLFGALYD